MAQGLFLRFAFISNFLNVNYFSFLDMLGLVNHYFWWKEYFPGKPGSYRYSNSIELVPHFGLWPSPPCGQRSSRSAESKRRALGNYFFERIYCMFLISKCRGDWDLYLFTTDFRVENRCAMATSEKKKVCRRRKNRIVPLRCDPANASSEVVYRPRSQSPLHFDIRNI